MAICSLHLLKRIIKYIIKSDYKHKLFNNKYGIHIIMVIMYVCMYVWIDRYTHEGMK